MQAISSTKSKFHLLLISFILIDKEQNKFHFQDACDTTTSARSSVDLSNKRTTYQKGRKDRALVSFSI